jgi:hypothetical protein
MSGRQPLPSCRTSNLNAPGLTSRRSQPISVLLQTSKSLYPKPKLVETIPKFIVRTNLLFPLLLAITLNSTLLNLVNAEVAVVIQCKINLTGYTQDGQIATYFGTTNLGYGYEVSLLKTGWFIKTIYAKDTYCLTGCDGTNVYNRFIDDTFVPPNPAIEIAESGTICAGLIPLNSDQWTVFPWFVYCSGSVIENRKVGDLFPVPWGSPREFAVASICEPDVEVFDRPPHLPKQCKFIVSNLNKNKILSTNLVNLSDKDELRLQINRYPNNFLAGEYRVISTTNFGGLEIPLQFECKRFEMSSVLSSNFWMEQIFRGEVQSVWTQNVESPLPPFPLKKRFVVMDTRLRDLDGGVRGFKYEVKDGVWPSIIPDKVRGAFEVDKTNKVIVTTSVSWRRRVVWLVFLLVIGIPPYFIFKKKQSSLNKE